MYTFAPLDCIKDMKELKITYRNNVHDEDNSFLHIYKHR